MAETEHKHTFQDLIKVRTYPTSATVGIFQCNCGEQFARPLTEEELKADG